MKKNRQYITLFFIGLFLIGWYSQVLLKAPELDSIKIDVPATLADITKYGEEYKSKYNYYVRTEIIVMKKYSYIPFMVSIDTVGVKKPTLVWD